MIAAIGLDCVEIKRFNAWHEYSDTSLSRIYSLQEIEYCRQNSSLSAQRFAVRFAAREALFKAMSLAIPEHAIPFLTLARATNISKGNLAPLLSVNWDSIIPYLPPEKQAELRSWKLLVSLTHTKERASALVIIEKLEICQCFCLTNTQKTVSL